MVTKNWCVQRVAPTGFTAFIVSEEGVHLPATLPRQDGGHIVTGAYPPPEGNP
ncbi:MAG TPA: hypothetical protein VGK18_12435 [Propionicimonas sp.]|uniref:hypothetical protein n=1 Tax=Propionicimonas sp. TaxID=1955623 RepID=UPI002F42A49B